MRRMNVKAGFTLVELLIVIAIIGVLTGILLPAVQQVRSAAQRTSCANNLRQLCLAIQNYESVMQQLPPGYKSTPTSNGKVGAGVFVATDTWDAAPGWGWGTYLLPFLEGNHLSDQLNLNEPIWASSNRELIQAQLPVYLCPTTSGDDRPFNAVDQAAQQYSPEANAPLILGRSNYVASHGQESAWGREAGSGLSGLIFTDIYKSTTKLVMINGDVSRVADGPFYRNSRTKLSEVTDGTTNSIFLGEHSSRLSDKTWVGVVASATVHPRFKTPENGPDGAATLVLVHAGPSGGEMDITGFPIIHPVNFPTYHVGQMYSEHSNGGNIGMGDGSVHFFSETIDLMIFAELSSINEGELVGDLQ